MNTIVGTIIVAIIGIIGVVTASLLKYRTDKKTVIVAEKALVVTKEAQFVDDLWAELQVLRKEIKDSQTEKSTETIALNEEVKALRQELLFTDQGVVEIQKQSIAIQAASINLLNDHNECKAKVLELQERLGALENRTARTRKTDREE